MAGATIPRRSEGKVGRGRRDEEDELSKHLESCGGIIWSLSAWNQVPCGAKAGRAEPQSNECCRRLLQSPSLTSSNSRVLCLLPTSMNGPVGDPRRERCLRCMLSLDSGAIDKTRRGGRGNMGVMRPGEFAVGGG